MKVNWIDPLHLFIRPFELEKQNGKYALTPLMGEVDPNTLYLSPPWIDGHTHCFYGVTSFGLWPDAIGYKKGVHMVVDAGSVGAETLTAFREFIVDHCKTKVRAFLNVSSIGHVTMREYFDKRLVDTARAARAVLENRDILFGIKVRSSAVILEGLGLWPLQKALEAAEDAACPLLVHMGERPPENEEILPLLRAGDIATHCFHGKDKPLWLADGAPSPALRDALARGVQLDVGHGAASFDKDIALAALSSGYDDFSISTDLHIRNVNGCVRSLPDTMTKFLALGLSLEKVIRAVTLIPARRFGLTAWCDSPCENATLFRLDDTHEDAAYWADSVHKPIGVRKRIVPVAVLMGGEMTSIEAYNS